VIVVDKDRESALAKAEEYKRLSSAEGYLAHAGGGGIDLAAYPKDALIADILAAENRPGRDNSPENRRYAPGATVGDALEKLTNFDRSAFYAAGSPTDVADAIERWVAETDLDGFNVRQFLTPGTAEDFITYVIPELQRRGLYRTKYEESTLRERLFGAGNRRLPETHPGARYRGGANLGHAPSIVGGATA
jgi:alkanesulfonate monooxygenase SsuD/methylene tetrahydromethanopterin reductase-like flavin-dependent oxidoreductase (luciferase family)